MFKRIFHSAEQSNPLAAETSTASCSVSVVQGEKDFGILGPLIFKATQEQKVGAILFSRGNPTAEDAEKGQIGFSVWGKDQDLTSRSWKASTLKDKKDMLGMCTISYQDGEIQEYQPPNWASYQHKPSTLRVDFLIRMNVEYNRLRRKHVNGVKHVNWEALYTLPGTQQSKAVGEDLIRWGFHHFNLARETILTFTEKPELFLSLGWEQVDVLDVDPRLWVGSKETDFSTFPVFVLVRKPGELPGVALVEAISEKP